VAPFHPLRDETRVFAARVLAAVAVFLTLAVCLLAGSGGGPLASAEAAKDPDGVPNGNANGQADGTPGNGQLGGGAAKQDPPAPEPVESPTSPTPKTEAPAPAPTSPSAPGKGTTGKTSDQDAGPAPTGGSGKGGGRTTAPGQVDKAPGEDQGDQPSGSTAQPATTQPPAQPARLGAGPRDRSQRNVEGGRQRVEIPTPGEPVAFATTEGVDEPAPAAAAGGFDSVGRGEDGANGSAAPKGGRKPRTERAAEKDERPTLIREIDHFVNVVPDQAIVAFAALAALSVLLGFGYLLTAMRNRSLARQRRELLTEVGLLQSALLPPVPERVGSLRTSVAYRPADGPGAGGDFYDVLPLPGGRVGFILGDVSGHGRGALARTAFMRYTLRAYLEAGLEPRVALQVAGRVIDENLGGDFATVLLAVHDPETGSLTYATAGHPAPLVVGPQPHEPVTAGSSPPIGVGVRTGLRQTTVPLVPGSVACMFTDGLMEARVDGGILGRERLEELLDDMGSDATAHGLIDRVHREARVLSDDIAAVVVQPANGVTAGLFRTEQLELTDRELQGSTALRFLEACGVPEADAEAAIYDARTLADRFGGVILHVVFGNRLRVEVLPRNVESIEAASRRAAAR